MKRIAGVLIAVLTSLSSAQEPSHVLTVHAEVVRQAYCRVDSEFFSVRLSVRLHFTNSSPDPLILARRLEDPLIIRGARDAAAIYREDYEFNPSFEVFRPKPGGLHQRISRAPEDSKFIILAPGKTFDTLVQDSFAAARRPTAGFLAPGDHVLQIGVSLWPLKYRQFDPIQLSAEWSRFGKLDTDTIFSDAVPFFIPSSFDDRACGKR
ncbi:MAG TPA: hypothetical protein VGL89_10425 [Candidatus Koribacter sp.]|jgi:hypothetical protein